ncbi:YncE family protein [Parerythrobacter aestuarii]|uniref:YncE family protein n=1 Tax=Parerythrobacter aestuarii TaxID=3020909 RepID=UPI0024DE7224|nr:YncE family protein [Parerythrobacter aestuarii]
MTSFPASRNAHVGKTMLRLAAPALWLAGCSPAAADLPPPEVVADGAMEGQVLFVTNKGEDTLSKVDLATGEEVQRVDSCTTPHELAVSPDGRHVALGCYGGRSITILRTADLVVVKEIELGEGARPHGIVWHANGNLYATAEGREAMVRVEDPLGEAPVLAEFKTNKKGTHMLTVAPDGSAAWTVDMGSGTVTRIDLAGDSPPLSVPMGEEPEGISLSPDGTALWVSARGSNEAFELDPATLEVRKRLETGRFPLRLAIRPQGDVAITSNLEDATLSVIELASGELTRTIKVGGPGQAEQRFQVTVLWSDDGSRIYVAETGSNTVAEVDYAGGKVLRHFLVGEDGDGLAVVALPESEGSGDE